jgi:predicted amidohydrolase YtcJ
MNQPAPDIAPRGTDDVVADRLLRVGRAYPMTGEGRISRALALSGDTIVAVAQEAEGLDHLITAGTCVIDAPDLTILPAFGDAHEHLLEAAQATALVPLEGVHSLGELADTIRRAAEAAPPGTWIRTGSSWHESDLAEGRLPTLDELDAASPSHPVYVRRGGHLAIANAATLQLAGVTAATPDPPGGSYGRDRDGGLNGLVEGSAVYTVLAHAPPLPTATLVAGLRTASAAYAALGVGSIREALIQPEEWPAYVAAAAQGALSVRARPLIRIPDSESAEAGLRFLERLDDLDRVGDDWLRLWGLKVVFDGGVEGAALDEPYADDPTVTGHVNWDVDTLVTVGTAAVQRGWRLGTHAVGDRAVRLVLDAYERIQESTDAPRASLVLEHALLADATQRARAARLGVPVTVQHSLLWNMGSEMLTAWGPERTARVSPMDEWLRLGAEVAVGTDLNRPFNPLINVWGMVTRGTKTAGVQGPEHGIDRYTAIERYTAGTARLCFEGHRRGTLEPGRLADLVAYPTDPLTADIDALPSLEPAFTVVGGRPVHDPDGRLAA